jgi:hypothetical protein
MDVMQQLTTVAASTRRQYVMNLRTVMGLVDGSATLETVVSQPHAVIPMIVKAYANPQTQKALIAAVLALFKHIPGVAARFATQREHWHRAFMSLGQKILDRVATAEPTDRELENWVPWKCVLEKQQSLSTSAYGSMDHLLLSMYSLIEPLRSDYGSIRLLRRTVPTSQMRGNYVSLPPAKPELVLNDYKTKTSYGQFRRALPDELVRVIQKSVELQPREHLFVNESGESYGKKNSFTRFANRAFERLFGKKFTIRMLRHSFVSSLDFNETTPAQLMQHSRNMLHSMSQQQLYRRKVRMDITEPHQHTVRLLPGTAPGHPPVIPLQTTQPQYVPYHQTTHYHHQYQYHPQYAQHHVYEVRHQPHQHSYTPPPRPPPAIPTPDPLNSMRAKPPPPSDEGGRWITI